MTSHDSDPSYGGPSFEDLNLYNEVVLRAGELAEAMQSCEAAAADRFYTISDPRIMSELTISETLSKSGLIAPDEAPSGVSLHLMTHRKQDVTYGMSLIHLDYSGERFFIRGDDIGHYLVPDVPLVDETASEPYMMLNPQETSDLIARLAIPYTDPELCDFKDINNTARISELCTSLDGNEFVDGTIEQTYAITDQLTVITQTRKEALVSHTIPVSIEITEDRGGDTLPLTLTIDFVEYANAAGMMKHLKEGSKEVPIDTDYLSHFKDVLYTLLKQVRPEVVSLEEYEHNQDSEDDRY